MLHMPKDPIVDKEQVLNNFVVGHSYTFGYINKVREHFKTHVSITNHGNYGVGSHFIVIKEDGMMEKVSFVLYADEQENINYQSFKCIFNE